MVLIKYELRCEMSIIFATSIKPALELVAKDYNTSRKRLEKNLGLSDAKLDYTDSSRMAKILSTNIQKKLNMLDKLEQNKVVQEQKKKLVKQKRLSVLAATFKKRKKKRKELYETIQNQIDAQKKHHLQQVKAQQEQLHQYELEILKDMEGLLNNVLDEHEAEHALLERELNDLSYQAMQANVHHHGLLHLLDEIDQFLLHATPQHVHTRMRELEQSLHEMDNRDKNSPKAESLRFQQDYLKEALGTSPKPSLTPPHHLKESLAQRHKEKQAHFQHTIQNQRERQTLLKQEIQSIRETLENLQTHKKELQGYSPNPLATKPTMTPIKKSAELAPKLSKKVPNPTLTIEEKQAQLQWKAPRPSPFH